MPSIKKNFFYSSILTTANYIFPLLTFPYVSRVLGVTNIGIVNFVDSIIHYFILVSMMGISIVGIREVAKCKGNRDELNQTFSGLFWLNTITTIAALVVLLVVTVSVDQLRSHWQMMAVGAFKLAMNYMLIEWLYKGLEEFRFITMRTLIVKTIYVVAVFVFVRESEDYSVYYLLSVLMIVANSFVNLIYARKFVSLKIRHVQIYTYFKPFILLGIYQLLTSMYLSINVTWLGFASGETEVGYYTTASKLYTILIALFTAFSGVMLPRMSSLLAEGKRNEFITLLAKANNILFTYTIPLIIFTIIYAPTIIYIISGPGYEGAITPMRIMMPLMLVIGYEQILVFQTLMPLKKDNAILRNSIAGASTGLLLNILLVPTFASVGASLVWFCSEFVVLCSAQYFVTKFVGVGFPWSLLFHNLLINVLLGVILCIVYTQVPAIWFSLVLSITICIVYFIICHIFIMPNKEVRDMLVIAKRVLSTKK